MNAPTQRQPINVLSSQAADQPGLSVLVLLASLAALGTLSTNIILPSFPSMGAELGISSREMGLTLSYFFVAFAVGRARGSGAGSLRGVSTVSRHSARSVRGRDSGA